MNTLSELSNTVQAMPWAQWAVSSQWLFLAYFIAINLVCLALNYISVFSIIRYMRDHRSQYLPRNLASYQPPVSILIPAFNEEQTIITSIRSLLRLNYPEFEIVVVNDGSSDRTVEAVIKAFAMHEFPEAYRKRIVTEPVKRIYASSTHANVRLVDKEKGGKADTLNAGINCARYPLFCVVDADCILQKDSLWQVVRPFLEDAHTVAVGGVVRVLNGCTVKDGLMETVNLPKNPLALFQIVDGAQVVGAGMLRGIHDTRVPMVYALFGYWAIGLGVGVALAFFMDWRGIGIWVGLAAGLGVVAVLMLWRWARRDTLGLLPASTQQ